MIKNHEFLKLKKVGLIIIFIIFAIGSIIVSSMYFQNKSDKKEQAAIVLQKKQNIEIENQKQEKLSKELAQKKIEEQKVLEDKKKVEEQKDLEDKKKVEEQKVLEEQKKVDEQKKADDAKVKEEASTANTSSGDITKDEASEIVSKIIINKIPKVKVEFDHIQKRDGKSYYVVRAYDDMGDHISTLGWYYVQINTGKAFEWDLIEDTLTSIN